MESGNSETGFSIVELLIVTAIITIITAGVIIAFAPTKVAISSTDAAAQVVNYMREANARAVGDHHSFRVVINLNTNKISLINENSSASGNNEGDTISGDDVLVKQEPLISGVGYTQPVVGGVSVGIPASPFNYGAATFPSNQWTAHFESDGSAQDPISGVMAPISVTLFFQPLQNNSPLLIRAVTLFGPGSSVRYWIYNGSKFVAG